MQARIKFVNKYIFYNLSNVHKPEEKKTTQTIAVTLEGIPLSTKLEFSEINIIVLLVQQIYKYIGSYNKAFYA